MEGMQNETQPSRETREIFDRVVKRLIRLSGVAVVQFINGLFGKNHPLDSAVEYPNTETVSENLRKLMSDTIIIIGGVHVYHIESEIDSDDAEIVLRVFDYGYAEGLRTKEADEQRNLRIRFPEAKIIYWEASRKAPDTVTLKLEFPDGGSYDYTVPTFKFLDYDIGELEARKLTILLPFYVLKLRRQVRRTKRPERRAELAAEMRQLMDELVAAVDRGEESGLMREQDMREVLELMERLYKELYQGYGEFKEVDVMLQDRLLTYSEEAELRGRQEGRQEGKEDMARNLLLNGVSPDIIAKSSGLPLTRIRSLVN
jgi:hypothetical protein